MSMTIRLATENIHIATFVTWLRQDVGLQSNEFGWVDGGIRVHMNSASGVTIQYEDIMETEPSGYMKFFINKISHLNFRRGVEYGILETREKVADLLDLKLSENVGYSY